MQQYKVYSNHQSPSRDIANMFATISALSCLAQGQMTVHADGMYVCTYIMHFKAINFTCKQCFTLIVHVLYMPFSPTALAGKGLAEQLSQPQVCYFLFGTPMSALQNKNIYKHGTLRKVNCNAHTHHMMQLRLAVYV